MGSQEESYSWHYCSGFIPCTDSAAAAMRTSHPIKEYTQLSDSKKYTQLRDSKEYTQLSDLKENTKLSDSKKHTKLSDSKEHTKLSDSKGVHTAE